MVEYLPALTFVVVTAAGGARLLRAGLRSMGLWFSAWAAIAAAAAVESAWPGAPASAALAAALSATFAGLLLVGALDESRPATPRWVWLGLGGWVLLRGALSGAGRPDLSGALGLLVEPGAELAAAILIGAAARRNRSAVPYALLGPAFAGVAGVHAWTHLAALGLAAPGPLLTLWACAAIVSLSVQSLALVSGLRGRLRLRAQAEDRAETALDETLARFRAITEHGFDLIAELDAELRVTYVSRNLRAFGGREPESGVGRRVLDFIHAEDRAAVGDGLRALVEGAPQWQGTARWRLGTGGPVWLEVSAHAFVTPSGERRLLLSGRDVSLRMQLANRLQRARDELEARVQERTAALHAANQDLRREASERQRAEQALRLSEERYRHTSELTSDYSYEVLLRSDGSHELRWITGAFQRITGYAPEDVYPDGWRKLIHPEDQARIEAAVGVLEGGQSVEIEYRILTRQGQLRWLYERMRAERDPESGDRLLYGAAHDTTEAVQARDARDELERGLREKQKLDSLGVLAGGIAHDFNNLLTAILGNAAIAYRDLPEDSPLRERIQRIARTAEYAAELTGQMLTYAGGGALTMKPLALSAVVEDMTALVAPQIESNVRLRTEFAQRLPSVDGDETQIRQLTMNLITNAADALAPGGGEIRVRTGQTRVDAASLAEAYAAGPCRPGDYVFLEVADTGPGMDAATRERIFEPFFTTKFSGRGLGLATVLGVVRGHGGAILVDSQPGQGSRFRVLLPIQREAGARREPARPVGGGDVAGVVLVIDDDEAVREVTQAFLERAGFRVLLAESGRRGLEILGAEGDAINLVLVDYVMPGLDGADVLRAVRRERPELPVIVSTGYTDEVVARRLAEGEFTAFLQKPYDPDQLVLRVRDAINAGA